MISKITDHHGDQHQDDHQPVAAAAVGRWGLAWLLGAGDGWAWLGRVMMKAEMSSISLSVSGPPWFWLQAGMAVLSMP